MREYIDVREPLTGWPARQARFWPPARRVHTRRVPPHFLPFQRAELGVNNAKGVLVQVTSLMHLSPVEVRATLDSALWDAAGITLSYLTVRDQEWNLNVSRGRLPDGHPLEREMGETYRVLKTQADRLDTEATEACTRITRVCSLLTGVAREVYAEDAARKALRAADRRGAYSAWRPDTTLDLTDRVAGLAAGLHELAAP